MSHHNIRNINVIFVKGAYDSDIWSKVARTHRMHKKLFFIAGGGTNTTQNFIDTSFLLNRLVKPGTQLHYFGLFDYNHDGRELAKSLSRLSDDNNPIKCVTIDDIYPKRFGWIYWSFNTNITIDDLLWNDDLRRKVDKGFFIQDYSQNSSHYSRMNAAFDKLLEILQSGKGN